MTNRLTLFPPKHGPPNELTQLRHKQISPGHLYLEGWKAGVGLPVQSYGLLSNWTVSLVSIDIITTPNPPYFYIPDWFLRVLEIRAFREKKNREILIPIKKIQIIINIL